MVVDVTSAGKRDGEPPDKPEAATVCHPDYGTFEVTDVHMWRADTRLEGGRQVVFRKERIIPLLFIRGIDGEAIVLREVVDWIWELDRKGIKNLRQKVRAIGLLFEYSVKVGGWGLWAERPSVSLLIWNFIACRLGMEQGRDAEASALPLWPIVTFDSARQDFFAIRQFADFCRRTRGSMSSLSEAIRRSGDFVLPTRRHHLPLDDMFEHLAPHRERWSLLYGQEPALPADFRSRSMKPAHRTKGDLGRDQVNDLVAYERNPVFRALWLLLAFGGIRLAEALNIWDVDILPGNMSRHFGNVDLTGMPLVVLAHPIHSRYLSDPVMVAQSDLTRSRALQLRYGLTARPALSKGDSHYAGWKGLKPHTGYKGDAFVYWTDWERSKAFEALVPQIRKIRDAAQSGIRHPYFFVNAIDPESRGDMLLVKNVESAFERACNRVGLMVGRSTPTVHWLRHFYKATAEFDLGLSKSDVQIMMHHASIGAQDNYGKRSRDLHDALSRLYGGSYAP